MMAPLLSRLQFITCDTSNSFAARAGVETTYAVTSKPDHVIGSEQSASHKVFDLLEPAWISPQ
jgi:hypothetical protein